jgi:hypothetical protein
VTSDPAGAKVHISGQADTTTPAEFPRLRIGNYRVTVSAPGYDPVTRTVQIKQGAASVLDAGALQRSYGSLSLETVPPHAAYRLTGSAADNQKEYRGSTPVTLTHLPVDSYQLVLTAPDMDSRTLTVTIASGQTTTQTEDLVKLDVAGDAASPAAKALLGQVPVSSLDDAGKNEYRDLLHRTFEKYLQDGLLPAAADQIAAMKAAGQDTQAQDKELAQARAAYEQSSRGEIQRLIQDGKFGAATSRLNAVEAIGGKDMADRLHGQFDGPLSAYHQKVDAAIQASQQGDPAAGYNQLKAVADEYPGDFTVQMALGQLLTRLPPDHARLSERLAAFHDFNEEDLGPAELAQFQGLQAHIENELNTYDRLADALNKAKEGPGNLAARIRHLQYQIEEDQQKINAAQNVNSTVNSLAGLFHQHVTVVDVGEKENEIASDQAEIAQDQAAEQSPNSGVQQAQQQFDQFCATVPW